MVLVIMLGFLGFKFYKVVSYSMDVPSEAAVVEGEKSNDIDIKFKDNVPDKASFQIISRKDLFRPSRTASVTPVRTAPKNIPTDPPKLFATIVRGSDSIAIIEDPDTKKSKSYRINDQVAGYLISEILEDRVILLLGADKLEIKLRDDKGIKTSSPKPVVRRNVERKAVKRPVPVRRRPANIPQDHDIE